jgi:hypothetical protein
MLADTSKDSRWKSIGKGALRFLNETAKIIFGKGFLPKNANKIGNKFFEHPLIKNYGSGGIFTLPSYIPTKNFSTVLLDVLKNEFNDKLAVIAQHKLSRSINNSSLEEITTSLNNSSDAEKLMELFNYYQDSYVDRTIDIQSPVIDVETVQILQMHLHNSLYSIEKFTEKIENWFDDSMNRVGGWYKRQAALVTFFIGLTLAITFNVDVIQIAGKLSVDKEAREKLVELSIQAVDKYKDDPRVIKEEHPDGTVIYKPNKPATTIADTTIKENINTIKKMMKDEVTGVNDILAIGWGDYGGNKTCFCKTWFVLSKSFCNLKKFLGFLLLALAVSLGAPFWFDLLGKLVKIRGAGKKEDSSSAGSNSATTPAQSPVTVTVNTQKAGEEAAG